MKKKLTGFLAGATLMMASNAMAIMLPSGSWTDLEGYLALPIFSGSTEVSSLDFNGQWKYTAIAAESGNYNIVEKPANGIPADPFNSNLSGDVTFTTRNTTNWGAWDIVNFSATNLFFEDSTGPMNVQLDPFTSTTTPGFKIYQLTADSALLNYLPNKISLKAGDYIVGFNDNSLIGQLNDADYDDIIIAMAPVPEPGTIVLLGAGLLGLGLYGRRRMKNN